MYGSKAKPKIEYPAVKTKPRVEQPKEVKPCPQKTQIEYPEAPRPERNFHMIDFVPRRKPGSEILLDLDQQKRVKVAGRGPGRAPQDRKALIEDLQEHMQFKDKAELERHIAAQKAAYEKATTEYVMDDKTRRQQRFKSKISANSLVHYEEKYGAKTSEIMKLLQKPSDMKHVKSAQDAELEDLFDSVVEEIEERQEFLEKMGKDIDKPTQSRIKGEIVTRIGELQRIREIQSKV